MGLGDGTLALDICGEVLAMPQENVGIVKDVVVARSVAALEKWKGFERMWFTYAKRVWGLG